MEELEKTARELIFAITEKTLKGLKDKGILKEPSKLQMLYSSPEMTSLIKKISSPKYDPCRLFRKGDKVRVVEWNGRNYYDLDHSTKLETGCLAEIWDDEEDEQLEGYVSVIYQGYIRSVPPCYLELVTPVEEGEPYSVEEDSQYWHVFYEQNGGIMTVCKFLKSYHPTAKAAAEAERDRLNAEWRKEVEK